MKRRALFLASPLLAFGSRTWAQAAPDAAAGARYVALSLVGDELTYVGAADGVTGTMHARGAVQAVPMPGAPFDRTVLEVLASAVPHARPGAALSFLASSAPEAFAHQDDWFGGGKLTLPPALHGAVAKEGASQLLLVTKRRGETGVSDGTTKFGIGKLTGLGFYIDRNTPMVDPKAGDVRGFIAPYVYVRLSLVDVATFSVTGQLDLGIAKPYTTLTPQDMMDALQTTLVDGLTDAVARVLKTG